MEEKNADLVSQLVDEVWNSGNLAAIDEFIAHDYLRHGAEPGTLPGPDSYKDEVAMYWTAFPDLQMVLEDLIEHEDKVVGRWVMRGSHRGKFMGIEATGKRVEFTGIFIVRIAGGKFVEEWEEADTLGLMRQLGNCLNSTYSQSLSWWGECSYDSEGKGKWLQVARSQPRASGPMAPLAQPNSRIQALEQGILDPCDAYLGDSGQGPG